MRTLVWRRRCTAMSGTGKPWLTSVALLSGRAQDDLRRHRHRAVGQGGAEGARLGAAAMAARHCGVPPSSQPSGIFAAPYLPT